MVTVVLVDEAGELLGALPPVAVPTPWLQEVHPVVAAVRSAHGLDVTVLRLLDASAANGAALADPGLEIQVSYLASTGTRPGAPLAPVEFTLAPHPLRPPYAELGGPRASLAWARSVLERTMPLPAEWPAGRADAEQVRTWNLSSIWRLHTPGGRAWLKEVPGFFAHEGVLLAWLARLLPGLAPAPLAHDGGRLLLADVPGEDRYGAPAAERLAVLERVHAAQLACVDAVDELLALGVPDRRAQPLAALIRQTVREYAAPELVEPLLAGLDERLDELAGCRIPDTLLHGDLHPGNVRGDGSGADVILDWGDSCLAHPGYDLLRMVEGLDEVEAAALTGQWCGWWRAAVPGCAPDRALELLDSVSALRNAAAYAGFLAAIEPSEHIYHRDDVPEWLGIAAASLRVAEAPQMPAQII